MPRKPSTGLPTKKQILDFIEQSGQPAGKHTEDWHDHQRPPAR